MNPFVIRLLKISAGFAMSGTIIIFTLLAIYNFYPASCSWLIINNKHYNWGTFGDSILITVVYYEFIAVVTVVIWAIYEEQLEPIDY